MPVLKGISVAEKIRRGVIFTRIPATVIKPKAQAAKVTKPAARGPKKRKEAGAPKKRAKSTTRPPKSTTPSPKKKSPRAPRASPGYLPTPPASTTRGPRTPSVPRDVIYVRTDDVLHVEPKASPRHKPANFNAKLRAALGLPPPPKPDLELYLRSLPGFDPDASASRMFTPQQQRAIERAFGFPTSPIVLSHDTREDAVAAASARMDCYLVDLFRAAVACEKYYPAVNDTDGGDAREDRMCDFFAAVGAAIDGPRREDPTWVAGYGASAFGGDVRMALFQGVFGSFRSAAEEAGVSTELACAVAKWEEIWWIKTGRL